MMSDRIRHDCPILDESYTEVFHKSGLTVLVSPKDFTTYHATLGVRYGSADRFTGARLPMGVAHFLEHKMFARADGSYDDDFAAIGAEVNAYTTYDRTAYMFSCTEHFDEALELLLRMLSSLSVTGRSVSRERGIIAEEIRMNADDPWERCYAEMLRALYRRHPVREEICGSELSIGRITPRMLKSAFDTFYRPDNMVLAVCGRVTAEAVEAVVDRVWGDARPAREPLPLPRDMREPPEANIPRTNVCMPTAKPLFCIGVKVPAPPAGARSLLRLDLCMTVLCEMLFSHSGAFYNDLFESGAVSPGMSYGSSLGEGYGYFMLSGECDNPDAVFDAFRAYVEDLHRTGLSEADLACARRILYADYVTGFDSTEDIAATMGGYALDSLREPDRRQKGVGLYDFLSAAEALTFEEVTSLFESAFRESQYTLSTVLPAEEARTSERSCL